MKTEKISKAIVFSIAECIIENLEYDELDKLFELPDGFVFKINPELAKLAARSLGMGTEKFSIFQNAEFKEKVIHTVTESIEKYHPIIQKKILDSKKINQGIPEVD